MNLNLHTERVVNTLVKPEVTEVVEENIEDLFFENASFRKVTMNQVNLIGRLTKDIEIKMTPSQKKATQFTLAVYRTKEDCRLYQLCCMGKDCGFVRDVHI